jgi:hypothetical protein
MNRRYEYNVHESLNRWSTSCVCVPSIRAFTPLSTFLGASEKNRRNGPSNGTFLSKHENVIPTGWAVLPKIRNLAWSILKSTLLLIQNQEIASLYPRFVEPFDSTTSLLISEGWTSCLYCPLTLPVALLLRSICSCSSSTLIVIFSQIVWYFNIHEDNTYPNQWASDF